MREGVLDPLRPHDVPAGRRDVLPPLRGRPSPKAVEEVSRRAELGRARVIAAVDASDPNGESRT